MPEGRSTTAPLTTPPSIRRSLQPAVQAATSPKTPRQSISPRPSLYLNSVGNRKSSDSWNSWSSSNPDEEFEWKPDQIKFLARTLDALPAHLTTPFNGRIPPPNLLDKLARSVTEAKGPVEWPHSTRSTRIRLLELARARAREDTLAERSKWDIIEEENSDGLPQTNKPKTTRKRPLYRQSSMDFVNDSIGETKDYSGIDRLASRLNSNERTFPNPSYQYPRALQPLNRSTPPPRPLNPSTPSSSTLNSLWSDSNLSCSSRPGVRRRSASTLATSEASEPSIAESPLPATPALTRHKRPESVGTPAPIPRPFKRAPSFGALAQEARHSGMDQDGVSCASSDEEEKRRDNKKAKTKDILLSPVQATSKAPKRGAEDKLGRKLEYPEAKRPSKRNPQRNPSMFGGELPYMSPPPRSPPPSVYSPSPMPVSSPATQPSSPLLLTPGSPSSPRVKTLRRMRRFDLSVGRRISFGSGHDGDEEADGEYHPFGGCAPSLGSAFQLI